ncbi:hypothetical protein HDE_12096 [Halotydeus destructor]|nr:hypothetical protein HDE_12096 [Halotydeus destructor]
MATAMMEKSTSPLTKNVVEQSEESSSSEDEFGDDSSISSFQSDDERQVKNGEGEEGRPDEDEQLDGDEPGHDNFSEDNDGESESPPDGLGENRVYRMRPLPKLQGTKPYRCEICQNSFQQKKSVYRHIKEVHKLTLIFVDDNGNECKQKSISTFPCSIIGCDLRFPNKKLLSRHSTDFHNSHTEPFSEDETEKPLRKKQKVDVQSKKTDIPFMCNQYGLESKHIQKATPYRCVVDDCSSIFQTKAHMMTHIVSVHRLKLLLVEDTGSTIINNGSPTPEKKFPCSYPGCESSFTRNSRRREHMTAKHPDYLSNGSSLAPLSQLVAVEQSPISITRKPISAEASKKATLFPKKYTCDFPGCDKAYTKSSHVKRHKMSAHLKEEKVREMLSAWTNTIFAGNEVNNDIVEEKPKAKDFLCLAENCESSFSRKSDLTRHMTKHRDA